MGVTIDELVVADPPEAWESAGFVVGPDAICSVGSVAIRLVGRERGTGIVGWTLRDLPSGVDGELDGIPTAASIRPRTELRPHPNGVVGIDHVVLLTPDLRRTVGALAAVDLHPRRERDGELGGAAMRQVFFRLGDVIVEVVGSSEPTGHGPATLWGLTHVVTDIDATAELLGDRVGRVKDAVQSGRRIATLRHRALGMSVHTAVISPHG